MLTSKGRGANTIACGLTPGAMLMWGTMAPSAVFMTEVRDTDVLFKRDSILGGRGIHFDLASRIIESFMLACPQKKKRDIFCTELQKGLQRALFLCHRSIKVELHFL